MDLNYILIMKVPFFLLGFALYMICCRIKRREPDEDDLIVPQPPSSIYVIPMHEGEGEQGDEDEHMGSFYSLPPYSELPPYNSLNVHCPPAYSQADAPPPPYTEDYQPPVEQC